MSFNTTLGRPLPGTGHQVGQNQVNLREQQQHIQQAGQKPIDPALATAQTRTHQVAARALHNQVLTKIQKPHPTTHTPTQIQQPQYRK